MTALHDMHCHLDFMTNGEQVAADAQSAGTQLFANTVTPEGYASAVDRFKDYKGIHIGLGLHPWWVSANTTHSATDSPQAIAPTPQNVSKSATGTTLHAESNDASEQMESDTAPDQLDAFLTYLSRTHFVGEVGLDFGRRGKATQSEQVAAFSRIAKACAQQQDKVISLHSVRSAKTVLDILEDTGALKTCTCIFHWFSDTTEQLLRARKAGCYFSINPMMASTGRGREYIKAIEVDKILLEADAPPAPNTPYSYEELCSQLQKAASAVTQFHKSDALEHIAATSECLLGFC